MPSQAFIAVLEISKLSKDLEDRMLPFINKGEETIDFDEMLRGEFIGAECLCAILWARALWSSNMDGKYNPLPFSQSMGIEIGLGGLRALAVAWGFTPPPGVDRTLISGSKTSRMMRQP